MANKLYRPILRFKRGEQKALNNLDNLQKTWIIPIVNLTSHAYNPAGDELEDTAFDIRISQDAARLNTAWGGHHAAVDLNDIVPYARCSGGSHYVRRFFDELYQTSNSGPITYASPVIRLDSDHDFISATAYVCNTYSVAPTIRLTPDDLATPGLSSHLNQALQQINAHEADSHIVIDMGYVNSAGRSMITASGSLLATPSLLNWNSVTLAAGSFPINLSAFTIGVHRIPRHEWDIWTQIRSNFNREILYGDYATIHPVAADDDIDPRTMNPTASVRYTFEDVWLLLRGQGTRTRGGPGFDQFYTHADDLVRMPEFRGGQYSFGDQKIEQIHLRNESKGNLETWVTVGVNHHMAEIYGLLSNLP